MSDRIRVLLTISDLRGGGAEREFSLLAQHLDRDRFEAHLCFWRPIFAYAPPPDLPVHMLEKTRPWHLPKVVRDLRRLLVELRPQLVFSQLHYVNMVTGTALAGLRNRPGWVARQVNDPRREMKGVFARWARWALARADRAVGCCDGVSDAMVEHLQLRESQRATLRNVVDLERTRNLATEPLPIDRESGCFTVVHAGRLHPQKNQALLLEAFARLGERPAELWMLGEGPEEESLRARARELGLGERVRWLGFRENPYPFYRAADCFALSSDHEGSPNAVIEAMACGTPVVSTACPYGPDELIDDGVEGRLVPVGDAEAFGRALVDLAGSPDRGRVLGESARRRTERDFDTAATCRSYERLFDEVLAARGSTRDAG